MKNELSFVGWEYIWYCVDGIRNWNQQESKEVKYWYFAGTMTIYLENSKSHWGVFGHNNKCLTI